MFTPEVLEKLGDELADLADSYQALMFDFIRKPLTSPVAREHATEGFGRRVKTLARCIRNVFEILPPNRSDLPSNDELTDATINLQAFVLNTFGAIDNLAWIWVSEKNVVDPRGRAPSRQMTGLSRKCEVVRASFPKHFQDYLTTLDTWFDQMEEYRHAVAHRIPLYIPPFGIATDKAADYHALTADIDKALSEHRFDDYKRLSAQQKAMGVFRPIMMHSFAEGARPVVLHAQMFADFKTVDELARKLLAEI